MTSGFLPVNGGQLYYETAGDPTHPALVLIHAGVANLKQWDAQVAHFADRYFVVRYDTRGFGRTTSDNVSFSNRQDVLDLLNHLNIERAIVVGNSRGGQIAADFTLEHPEIVRALILIAAGLSGLQDGENSATPAELEMFGAMEKAQGEKDWDTLDELELRLWYDGLTRPVEQVDPAYRAKGQAMMLENRAHIGEEPQAQPLDPPAVNRLGEIHVPTLFIYGDLDTSDTPVVAQRYEAGIRGARSVVMVGTAHMPSIEQPKELHRILDPFLAGL